MAVGTDDDEIEGSRKGFALCGVLALIFVIISLLLIFLCSGGFAFPLAADALLTLFHAGHLIMLIIAIFVFFSAKGYVPPIFGLLALLLISLDGYVFVTRILRLISLGISICLAFYFIADIFFLIISIGYLLNVMRTLRYYAVEGGLRSEPPSVVSLATNEAKMSASLQKRHPFESGAN